MILQRYIATSLVQGWLLVLLVIGSVFGLIAFITELERTRFDYDALAVARFTLYTLPQKLVMLAPVVALLGSIVALASLDRYNELTVMSCAGIPRRRLLRAIAMPTLLFMVLLWVCLEYATPRLHQTAEQQRHALRYRGDVRIPDGGVWSRSGRRYLHLGQIREGGVPGDIDIYEFDESGQLVRAIHANVAEVLSDRRWRLKRLWEKQLVDGELQMRRLKELVIDRMWAKDELPTLQFSSDSMTLSVLYNYASFLRDNGQPASAYFSSFWQRLLMPLTVAAMVLLATPISASLGSRRNRGFGVNMAIGAVVGILFYLGAQIVFALGQLLKIAEPLVALAPTAVVLLAALALLRRMRW
jgi:lipopolysaccharide export system permease protein